jgi:hypothetical protein
MTKVAPLTQHSVSIPLMILTNDTVPLISEGYEIAAAKLICSLKAFEKRLRGFTEVGAKKNAAVGHAEHGRDVQRRFRRCRPRKLSLHYPNEEHAVTDN